MARATHAKVMSAAAWAIAGSLLGCAAQVPAGPDSPGPIGRAEEIPHALAPSSIGAGVVPVGPEELARSGILQDPVSAAGLGGRAQTAAAPGPAPAIAIPENAELAISAETMNYRAPIHSLEDVLKQSGLGPVPESQAPPTDMIKRILPQKLTQAQAASLLIKVPADMVRAGDIPGSVAGGSAAVSGGGQIAASAWRGRGDGPPPVVGSRRSRSGQIHSRDDLSDPSYGRSNRGSQGPAVSGQGASGRDRVGGRDGTSWSRFATGDADLVFASSAGWGSFAWANSFYFFPATIFSALHFFPYTFVDGYFYPAYCPFYFSAAFFIPYCQAPVVWYGTLGLVSGCPTCPISGRPLLWLPGEVPVI